MRSNVGPFTVVAPLDVRPESQTMRRADSALFTPAVPAGRALDMQSTPCHLLPSRPDRLTLRSVRENVDVLGELLPRDAALTSFLRFHLRLHGIFLSR